MSADLLLRGPAYLVDAARSWSSAVAVGSGRIAAVGPAAERLVGPDTRIVDAQGGLVLPGFVDAHVHPGTAGRNQLTVDLTGLDGRSAYLAAIARYAEAHPHAPWITGGGWSMEHFPGGLPDRRELDAVTGNRPAFLFNRDVHGAWVNSAALAIAGITAATPDPPDGRIERAAGSSEPSGTLHEGAAYRFEVDVLPAPTTDDWQEALLAGQQHLHRLGVTSWQDAWVTPDLHRAYRQLATSGRLTGRVVGALWWDRNRGLEQIPELLTQRAESLPGRYLPTTVKIMVDGVVENGTAALLAPYCRQGISDSSDGLIYLQPDLLAAAVRELDRLNFQIHFHAIGDRAVRMSLDAVETAREHNGWNDNRHHIAHVQLIDPADLHRFRALQVTATLQTYWAQHEPQMDELTIPVLGNRRAALQYPFADLHSTGASLALGSDWGVTTADPLRQLQVAVTHRDPDLPNAPVFLVRQRLSLPVAVAAGTAGSAWINHDDDAGIIAPGRRADLVVLDRNIFAGAADRIADAQVLATFVAGAEMTVP